MGAIYANLKLMNADEEGAVRLGLLKEDSVHTLDVKALVDTGADMMTVPDHVTNQLNLPVIEYREFKLADGSAKKLPVVGPVSVEFANRRTICYVVSTLDDEVLLGSIPMEDLDVVLNPRRQTMEINPESPYLPTTRLK